MKSFEIWNFDIGISFFTGFLLSPFSAFQDSTRPANGDLKGQSDAAPLPRPNSETSTG